jgi:hypothetical protein
MPVLDRSALEDLPGMDFLAAALGDAQPKAGAADTPGRAMSGRFSDRRRCGTGVLPRRGGVRPTPASPCESTASLLARFGVAP